MYAGFKTEGRKPSIHAGALKFTQVSCLKNGGNQYLTEIGFMITTLVGRFIEFPQEPKDNRRISPHL